MLKNKFRRLKYLDVVDKQLATKIIAAEYMLHNFIINHEDVNMFEYDPDSI